MTVYTAKIETSKKDRNGMTESQVLSSHAVKETFFHKYYHQVVTSVEVLIDFLTLFGSFLLAKGLYFTIGLSRYETLKVEPISFQSNNLFISGACVLVILVFSGMGLYRKHLSLLNIDEMRRLFRAVLAIAIIFITVSFYLRIPFSRILLTTWLCLILFFTTIVKMIFFKIHQALHLKGLNIQRVLIYGAGEIGRKLYKNILTFPKLGYRAVGFLDEDPESFAAELKRVDVMGMAAPKLLGTTGELDRIVREHQIDEIIIARKGMSSDDISALTSKCKELDLQFKVIPQLYGHFIENLTLQEIGGIPLIGERETHIRRFDLIIKRMIDLVLAVTICLFFLPIFLVIATLIRKDSKGPIIFRQKRVGKKGKEFTIYKFRTMHVDSDRYSHCPKGSDDPRITPIGRFLRKTSLDEFPQFFNVLKGEMSIVGPRPEMPFIVEEYNPLHMERLRVKPGITGLWQISADRQLEIHENIDYDLYYIQNFSILLDVAIMFRTVLHGLFSMKTA